MPTLRPIATLRKTVLLVLYGLSLGTAHAAAADEVTELQRLYYAGQASVAMQRADDYLASHPKDARVRFLKGVMLADAKRTVEAISVFQKLNEDYPDLAEPYNNLAALYAAAGDYARARGTLEQALRANPSYAIAQENLGDIYAALAAQAYARTLKLDPANASAPTKLALIEKIVHAPGSAASAAAVGLQRATNPAATPSPTTSTGTTP